MKTEWVSPVYCNTWVALQWKYFRYSSKSILPLWEHPHSHLPIHRYASQHVSQCRSTHTTTFQLTVIHHSNATSLSPILLSLQPPVSARNSRNKRRFTSQLLTQHFRANSHAYQTYQPTNGRADERENHIKRPRFQPERQYFDIDIQRRLNYKNHSRKTAASRQWSTPDCPATIPRGPGTPPLIKTDSQSVSGGVIGFVDSKRSRIVGDSPERSKASFDTRQYHHTERRPVVAVPGACRSIFRQRSSVPLARREHFAKPSRLRRQQTRQCHLLPVFHTRRRTPHSSFNSHQVQTTSKPDKLLAQRMTKQHAKTVWQTK